MRLDVLSSDAGAFWNELDIWVVDIKKVLNGDIGSYVSTLSVDEKKTAQCKATDNLYRKDVLSKSITRIILAKYLMTDPFEIPIKYSEYGKPFVNKKFNLNFNISNSGDYILVAVSRKSEVGVDVEKRNDVSNYTGIARRFFTNGEVNLALNCQNTFYDIWCLKESFSKSIGIGMGLDFKLYEMIKSKREFMTCSYNLVSTHIYEGNQYVNYLLNIAEEYSASVSFKMCEDGTEPKLRILDYFKSK